MYTAVTVNCHPRHFPANNQIKDHGATMESHARSVLANDSDLLLSVTVIYANYTLKPEPEMTHESFVRWSVFLTAPTFAIVGTIFSILSLTVLSRVTLRNMAVTPFFMAMAILDVLVLYSTQLPGFYQFLTGSSLRNTSDFACRTLVYVIVVSRWCSAWIIVAMTSQRVCAVFSPVKARRINNVKVSRIIVVSIVVTICISCSHFLGNYKFIAFSRSNQTVEYVCAKVDKHFIYDIWPFIDLSIGTCIPFLLICIFNCLLVRRLVVNRQKVAPKRNSDKGNSVIANTSCMLVTVSVVFLTLSLPITIYFIARPYLDRKDPTIATITAIYYTIANVMQALNHTINFLLYCATGPSFRKELRHIFRRSSFVVQDSVIS